MEYKEKEDRFQNLSKEIIESGYPEPLWKLVKDFSLQYLEKGRKNFDVPHTKGTVYWVFRLATDYNKRIEDGEISGKSPVDIDVLITSAWLHDIGYFGKFEGEARADQIRGKKTEHMSVGAKIAGSFLIEYASEHLTIDQIGQVIDMIGGHDNLDEEKTDSEAIFLEADTLGGIDVTWVEPTYRGEEALNYLDSKGSQKRRNLFITPLGLEQLPKLREKFRQFIVNRDFEGIRPDFVER